MVVLLCIGVFGAGFLVIALATWLVHVAKREAGFWHVKTGQFHDFR
jgi:hypothetical protein